MARALDTILAAAIAIVAGTAWTMIRPHVQKRAYVSTLLVAGAAQAAGAIWEPSPIYVLIVADVIGALKPGATPA